MTVVGTLRTKKDGSFELTSRFDKALLDDIRNIPKRAWNANAKVWTFPADMAPYLRALAESWQMAMPKSLATVAPVNLANTYQVALNDDEQVCFSFPYDPKLVSTITSHVPAAVYHKTDRTWRTSIENIDKALEWATYHGLTIDPAVKREAKLVRTKLATIEEASRATESSFVIPGIAQELLPYQRAGVEYLVTMRRAILGDEMGLGKGHPRGTKILTVYGWRAIEDIRVGDRVIGANGYGTPVTGVYPRGELPVYRVTFNDGASVLVDGDHLWSVQHVRNGHRHPERWESHETRWIASHLSDGSGNSTWKIPVVAPVQYAAQPTLPLDPYVVGVLIGDGTLTRLSSVILTSADDELVKLVEQRLPDGAEIVKHKTQYSYGIKSTGHRSSPNPVRQTLTALGLTGNAHHKFIPEPYMRATVTERLQLLRGLMDTDGHAGADGTNEYCTVSRELADDVAELVQSLGGIVRRGTKHLENGTAYRVNVKLTVCPFLLSRKATAWLPPTKYPPNRIIRSIEPAGTSEVICLAVGADDHLYVTEHCIVTHNTAQGLSAVVAANTFPVIIVCPNSMKLTWANVEIPKWFPHLTVNVISGTSRSHIPYADVQVINYDILGSRTEDLLALKARGLIVDESHYIRNGQPKYVCPSCDTKVRVNSRTCSWRHTFQYPKEMWTVKRTEGVMRLARAIPDDGAVFLMTGSPVHNRPTDLIPQLMAVGHMEAFGGRHRFTRRYYRDGEPTNVLELNQRLRQTCYIRRDKKDIYEELPEMRVSVQLMEPTAEKMVHYREVERDVVEYLARRARELAQEAGEDGQRAYWEKKLRAEAAEHLVRISALKNACAEIKLSSVQEWIKDFMEDDEKLIVFAEHVSVVESLYETFGDLAVKIRGGVKQVDRLHAVERFQTDPTCKLFLGNIAAASEGLTLTAASTVAMVEQPWTWEGVKQAVARCYGRVNDLHGAVVHFMLVPDTIDITIYQLLEAKRRVSEAITSGVDPETGKKSILAELVVALAKKGLGD